MRCRWLAVHFCDDRPIVAVRVGVLFAQVVKPKAFYLKLHNSKEPSRCVPWPAHRTRRLCAVLLSLAICWWSLFRS